LQGEFLIISHHPLYIKRKEAKEGEKKAKKKEKEEERRRSKGSSKTRKSELNNKTTIDHNFRCQAFREGHSL
jgi:hypothetical protein